MRPPLAVVLMILAVPLMGSDCYVSTRVNAPPPPPPPDGGGTPPPTGGGIIIVTSGNPMPASTTAAAVRIERSLVASALTASVWTPPDTRPSAASSGDPDRRIAAARESVAGSPLLEAVAREASVVVPEPTGLVLFAWGVAIASSSLPFGRGRGRSSGGNSSSRADRGAREGPD